MSKHVIFNDSGKVNDNPEARKHLIKALSIATKLDEDYLEENVIYISVNANLPMSDKTKK